MKEHVGKLGKHPPLPADLENAGKEVIGAAIEVHRHLGPGLLETIYETALLHELNLRGLGVKRQVPVNIVYKGVEIHGQRLDLLVEPGIVVELKSVDAIAPVHERQVVSYLKSSGFRLGFLINFNVPVLKDGIKRFAN